MARVRTTTQHDPRRTPAILGLTAAGLATLLILSDAQSQNPPEIRDTAAKQALTNLRATKPSPPTVQKPAKMARRPAPKASPISLKKAKIIEGAYVQTMPNGDRVTFTIKPDVQRKLRQKLKQNKVPYGGVVVLEPKTGRVLALASHNEHQHSAQTHVATTALAPSASVFKIITLAALLEGEGFSSDKKVCYHGGRRGLTKKNIQGDPKLDRRCATLSDVMAWSINAAIAKMSFQHLSRKELLSWTERFGFNQPIPFELAVDKSVADVPKDPYERARMSAGFWHSKISALHGAMISAAVMNDGVMMTPSLIESVQDSKGVLISSFTPKVFKRVMKKKTARSLRSMMKRTTTVGTARKYFRHSKMFPSSKIVTGGKTGTLSRKKPTYLGYTWFVGFGSSKAKHRDVAVGSLVCNTPLWHIKGSSIAADAIRWAMM